jgi:hypothetical protein
VSEISRSGFLLPDARSGRARLLCPVRMSVVHRNLMETIGSLESA